MSSGFDGHELHDIARRVQETQDKAEDSQAAEDYFLDFMRKYGPLATAAAEQGKFTLLITDKLKHQRYLTQRLRDFHFTLRHNVLDPMRNEMVLGWWFK